MTSINGDATIDLGGGKTEKIDAVHAVNYDRLTVPLVKAVQQQQAEIEAIKAGTLTPAKESQQPLCARSRGVGATQGRERQARSRQRQFARGKRQ